jgi:hypothetical protein
MTRKDYVRIAHAIKLQIDTGLTGEALEAVRAVADNLADTLHRDNPLFNRAIFLEACGF